MVCIERGTVVEEEKHPSRAGGDDVAIVVSGAGCEDANGLFVSTGRLMHSAPVFENEKKCLLSREPHRRQNSKELSYGWILGQNRLPLYAAQTEELLPPPHGWQLFSGASPLPTVSISRGQQKDQTLDAPKRPSGNCDGGEERVALTSLPYHKMGLPKEQTLLMDQFFKQMRDERDIRNQQKQEKQCESTVSSVGQLESTASTERNCCDSQGAQPRETTRARRTARELELDREEALEKEENQKRIQMELSQLALSSRWGEPHRFEQAAGEVYAWWTLPTGVAAKEIQVTVTQGGTFIAVKVRDAYLCNRKLFHAVRQADTIWTVMDSELHVTMTKAERSKLWESLTDRPEIQHDHSGSVVPETLPEPMSALDRVDKFKQMIHGDDGAQEPAYEDLDGETRYLVDKLRAFERCRATGDAVGLAEAESALEEMGQLVV